MNLRGSSGAKDKSAAATATSSAAAAAGGGSGQQSSGENEREEIKVCKWDGSAVKNALDDAVKDVMIYEFQYEEDNHLMDMKLGICGLAVAVAMFALVFDYFVPFPASRQVLISCVVAYFVLMLVLNVYTTYKEKGIFLVALEKDPAGLDPDSTWEVSSHMKKFDDIYQLILTHVDGRTGKMYEDSFTHSVGEFFDDDGVLSVEILEEAVLKLHRSLSSSKKKD